ncbi:hypothetical protein MKW94_022367 [Papaver nudicaule]|uniref:Ubiquitin carboxyl-terminal hydrolase n=1 Tax=Papaver nudicaule TaxID=74823 RepID=A0AA41S071_PAPNU|nr:hypothetical protein [Papaver nudicaule]
MDNDLVLPDQDLPDQVLPDQVLPDLVSSPLEEKILDVEDLPVSKQSSTSPSSSPPLYGLSFSEMAVEENEQKEEQPVEVEFQEEDDEEIQEEEEQEKEEEEEEEEREEEEEDEGEELAGEEERSRSSEGEPIPLNYDNGSCYSTPAITSYYSRARSHPYRKDFNLEEPSISSSRVSKYDPSENYYSRVSNEVFSPIGAGLWNLGNTCFLNSVLQCFTHTVPLLQNLVTLDHPSKCRRNAEDFCVIRALHVHIDTSLQSVGRAISPYSFVNNLGNISSSFHRYQQEDAHEFLQCLMDKIDTSCCEMDMQVRSPLPQEDSFIKSIFGGRLKSQLKCCNCDHCSITFEPLIDLSLEIEDVDTLVDALKSFTKIEKIEDSETKFICDNCKKEVVLEKQFTLDQAPSVAAFHLKRFKNDGFHVEKVDKDIKYPLELDLQPYTGCSENFDEKLKYELYAVIVHSGISYSSGHYFCYVRSSPGIWFLMDDSRVVIVSEQQVLSQEAYILFYAKSGTPSFSSFFSEMCNKSSISTSPNSVLDNLDAIHTPSPGPNDFLVDGGKKEYKERAIPTCGDTNIIVTRADTERISIPSSGASNTAGEDSEIITAPASGKINVTGHAAIGVSAARISVSSPGASGLVGDVDTKEDKGTISSRTSLGNDNFELDNVALKTPPPRSPVQDVFSDESFPDADISYSISRDHLKVSKVQLPCRRSSSAKKDDVTKKRSEAMRLTKSMPGARGEKLRKLLLANSECSKRKKGLSFDVGSTETRRRLIK